MLPLPVVVVQHIRLRLRLLHSTTRSHDFMISCLCTLRLRPACRLVYSSPVALRTNSMLGTFLFDVVHTSAEYDQLVFCALIVIIHLYMRPPP